MAKKKSSRKGPKVALQKKKVYRKTQKSQKIEKVEDFQENSLTESRQLYFFKLYYWIILFSAGLNFFATLLLFFIDPITTYGFISFVTGITLIEVILFVYSIILLIVIFSKGLNKKLMNFPIFYVIIFSVFAYWGYNSYLRQVDFFNLEYGENILAHLFSLLFYLIQVVVAYRFVFKKRRLEKKSRKLKRKKFVKS